MAISFGWLIMRKQNIAVSISEIESAFSNHAADAGVIFTDRPLIADGLLHRAHVEGDRRGTKNGAYVVHVNNNPAGWFQHFKTGISGKWTLSGKQEPMTCAMKKQIEADKQRSKIKQTQRHNDAADRGRLIWHRAKSITEQSQHLYLIKKCVQPHGARLYRDALVIPIYDESKQLVNLQLIGTDGGKRFLSGGRKKGCFSVIGRPHTGSVIQVSEGWATGASVHEANGQFTVVALDAGNLEPVALVMQRLYPDRLIILCGDNDNSGVGQRAAKKAAKAVGGKYIIPVQPGEDWNDVLNMKVGL